MENKSKLNKSKKFIIPTMALMVASQGLVGNLAVNAEESTSIIPTEENIETPNVDEGVVENVVDANEADLSLHAVPNIDVVLSVGRTRQDVTTFESDILKELENLGVNTERVNIQAVETNDVQTTDSSNQGAFQWQYYGHEVHDGWAPKNGKRISIINGGKSLYFDGYYNYGYVDFMYMPNNDPYKKTFTFNMLQGTTDYHAMEGGGFMFNTVLDKANNKIQGYAVILGATQIRLYQINSNLNTFYNANGSTLASRAGVTLLQTYVKPNNTNHNLKIEADAYTLNLTHNGTKIIDNRALPVDYGSYGFAPIASHASHGCSVRSNFTFSDIKMQTTAVKSFKEIVSMPDWGEYSKHVLVHIDETAVPDFQTNSSLGEIVPRLAQDDIHLLTIGNNANKESFDDVIGMNNSKGASYDIGDYKGSIKKAAEYIKSILDGVNSDENIFLLGEEIGISADDNAIFKNTADEEYPDGKWMVKHDYKYFDNNLGLWDKANTYMADLDTNFTKPGRYEILHKDRNVNTKYIYVHREPVASFDVTQSHTPEHININYINNSYDPDRETASDKGIKEEEWKHRLVNSDEWVDGKPEQIGIDTEYVVQLRVKDEYGVWSKAVQRYVTAQDVNPVSSFSLNSPALHTHQKLGFKDASYSPDGRPITELKWTMTKDGKVVYTGAELPSDLKQYGTGTYKISLAVKNDANKWSSELTRTLTVNDDIIPPSKPDITVDEEKPTNQSVMAEVEYSEDTAKKLVRVVYHDVVEEPETEGEETPPTEPTEPETEGNEGEGTDGEETPPTEPTEPETEGGETTPTEPETEKYVSKDNTVWEYYTGQIEIKSNATIYALAVDEAGNESVISVKDVKNIDTDAPDTPEISHVTTDKTNQDVLVTVDYSDDSVIKKYKIGENGVWKDYTEPFAVEHNTTVYAYGVDNADNPSETKEYIIDNIDKTAPNKPVLELSTFEPTNKIVTAQLKYSDDSEVKMYRVGEKGEFKEYLGEFTVTANTKVYAYAIDDVGNKTEEFEYVIDNIDTEPPTTPKISHTSAEITNQDVTVTIDYSDDSDLKKYKINDGEWLDYTAPFVLGENAKIYAYAEDELGNKTKNVLHIIKNIDKIPPPQPEVVVLYDKQPANFAKVEFINNKDKDKTTIRPIDSDGNALGKWKVVNNDEVYLYSNGLYEAKYTDRATNESELRLINITDIDPDSGNFHVEVDKNYVYADLTPVLKEAEGKALQYKIDDTDEWVDIPESGLVRVLEDCTVHFKLAPEEVVEGEEPNELVKSYDIDGLGLEPFEDYLKTITLDDVLTPGFVEELYAKNCSCFTPDGEYGAGYKELMDEYIGKLLMGGVDDIKNGGINLGFTPEFDIVQIPTGNGNIITGNGSGGYVIYGNGEGGSIQGHEVRYLDGVLGEFGTLEGGYGMLDVIDTIRGMNGGELPENFGDAEGSIKKIIEDCGGYLTDLITPEALKNNPDEMAEVLINLLDCIDEDGTLRPEIEGKIKAIIEDCGDDIISGSGSPSSLIPIIVGGMGVLSELGGGSGGYIPEGGGLGGLGDYAQGLIGGLTPDGIANGGLNDILEIIGCGCTPPDLNLGGALEDKIRGFGDDAINNPKPDGTPDVDDLEMLIKCGCMPKELEDIVKEALDGALEEYVKTALEEGKPKAEIIEFIEKYDRPDLIELIEKTPTGTETSTGEPPTGDTTENDVPITSIVVPPSDSNSNTNTGKPTGSEQNLPQTGAETSATTGGLMAMLLGLLTFGLYNRKRKVEDK